MQDYLRWLSRVAGENYRLLTSAEWEYVARAGGALAWIDAPGEPTRHPFGVSGLHFGTWVRGGSRGGSWSLWPIQDRDEAIVLHAAYRPSDGGVRAMLLAADPP